MYPSVLLLLLLVALLAGGRPGLYLLFSTKRLSGLLRLQRQLRQVGSGQHPPFRRLDGRYGSSARPRWGHLQGSVC